MFSLKRSLRGEMPRRKQAKQTTVKDLRSILRLTYEQGLSVRAISERLQISKTSVATYLLRTREAGLSWPLPPTYDSEAALLRATFPCETALWLFQDFDRRRKLKGWARTWMSHHQIPRLDGDQAERCDGNLPFASRLMALLSTMGHWAGQAFAEG
jgi:hypothetical protein